MRSPSMMPKGNEQINQADKYVDLGHMREIVKNVGQTQQDIGYVHFFQDHCSIPSIIQAMIYSK